MKQERRQTNCPNPQFADEFRSHHLKYSRLYTAVDTWRDPVHRGRARHGEAVGGAGGLSHRNGHRIHL